MARQYRISGRVQGVGFRYFVQRAASELALTGWVANREDGTVEAHANGTVDQLSALEARLWQGPPGAEVRSVKSSTAAPSAAAGFDIR